MKAFYKEESKLGATLIWLFTLVGFVPFAAGLILLISTEKMNSEAPFIAQILLFLTLTIVFILLLNIKLEFEIRDGVFRYKMFPLNWKWQKINISDISSWEIKKINPIFYAGGWGYRRRFFQKKKAMITKGNMGIELILKNGKILFLSTTHPNDLEREMKKLMEELHG